MANITITSAQYQEINGERVGIWATVDGVQTGVPLDPDNRHYAEIMRQVAAGTLTIADAD